jgi:hypothetical protein
VAEQGVEVVVSQAVALRGAAQCEGGDRASDVEERSAFSHNL